MELAGCGGKKRNSRIKFDHIDIAFIVAILAILLVAALIIFRMHNQLPPVQQTQVQATSTQSTSTPQSCPNGDCKG
jgi:hypothetical protein